MQTDFTIKNIITILKNKHQQQLDLNLIKLLYKKVLKYLVSIKISFLKTTWLVVITYQRQLRCNQKYRIKTLSSMLKLKLIFQNIKNK